MTKEGHWDFVIPRAGTLRKPQQTPINIASVTLGSWWNTWENCIKGASILALSHLGAFFSISGGEAPGTPPKPRPSFNRVMIPIFQSPTPNRTKSDLRAPMSTKNSFTHRPTGFWACPSPLRKFAQICTNLQITFQEVQRHSPLSSASDTKLNRRPCES